MNSFVTSDIPVFIHSLFRGGSTYIFQAFQRSKAGFWCYYEPLHEVLAEKGDGASWKYRSSSDSLLNHPVEEKPYFWELIACSEIVEAKYRDDFAFRHFFLDQYDKDTDLYDYITALINAPNKPKGQMRPVFQFCRSVGRMAWFAQSFEGQNIYLWRNPWDQWWSYKINRYFDETSGFVFANANLPKLFQKVAQHELIRNCFHTSLDEKHYPPSRHMPLILDHEQSYLLFYTIWVYALLESRKNTDISINIDMLANSDNYRRTITKSLEDLDISGLDFSDAKLTPGLWDADKRRFFAPIEDFVHSRLTLSGYKQEDLDWVLEQRALHLPARLQSDTASKFIDSRRPDVMSDAALLFKKDVQALEGELENLRQEKAAAIQRVQSSEDR